MAQAFLSLLSSVPYLTPFPPSLPHSFLSAYIFVESEHGLTLTHLKPDTLSL